MKTSKRKNGTGSVLANLAGMALFVGCLLASGLANAAIIGQWSFADQGATANADMAASSVISGANVSGITAGTGYTQMGQVVGGTFYTYADSGQNSGNYTKSDGTALNTDGTFYVVGDWDDGTTTGGRIESALFKSGQELFPSGSGPTGAGGLYLNSGGSSKANLDTAIANNLGVTFDVTASGATLNLTDFSFYGSRGGTDTARSWVNWYLQVDSGSGFSTLSTGSGIPTDHTWGLQTADPFDLTLNDGESATFRLIGTATDTSSWGRTVALDDLVVGGTVIPEPASLGLFALVGGLLWFVRRRVRA